MNTMTKKILSLAALGAVFASDALAAKIESFYTPTSGATVSNTGRFTPGSYVYMNGQYFYVDGNSPYAGGSVNRQHSTVVTEVQVTRVATQQQLNFIEDRLSDLHGGNSSSGSANLLDTKGGANGGSHDGATGVWAKAGWTHLDDDTSNGSWDGHLWTAMIGMDRKLNKHFTAGLGLYYSFLDIDTKFNNGDGEDHAYGVTPYLGINVNHWLSFDVMGGWAHVDKDRTRKESTIAGTTRKVKGKVDSDRWFAGVFANLKHQMNRWGLLLRAGYHHAEDRQDSFRENNGDRYTKQNVHLDILSAKLQAGYKANDTLEPYVNGRVSYDADRTKIKGLAPTFVSSNVTYIDPTTRHKKFGFGLGAGLNITGKNGWGGNLGYDFGSNKKLKTHSVSAKVRYQF